MDKLLNDSDWLKLSDEGRAELQEAWQIIQRAEQAEAEASRWRDEYNELCKFTNDYEARLTDATDLLHEQANALRQARLSLVSAPEFGRQWFNDAYREWYNVHGEDSRLIALEAIDAILKEHDATSA